jgi:hypothetical protein
MIIPQKQWREENRASHGLYLDTPPLKGRRMATLVAIWRLFENAAFAASR